jgi:glutathione S-transferase
VEIASWNARADELCEAGRVRSSKLALESKDALLASLPSSIPTSLHPMMAPVARRAARYLLDKYDDPGEDAMRETLEAARRALGGQVDRWLLGGPTYADIALATALQFVAPVEDRYVRLEPAARAIWRNDPLAREFGDLLVWRNRVFEALNAPTRTG